MFWFLSLLCLGLTTWFYFFLQKRFTYWSSRGIPGPPPRFPFGNMFNRMNVNFFEYDQKMVQQYGKVYGTYSLWKPAISIADPQFVKQVLIKDFPHFADRINAKAYQENLFTTNGDDWRRMRTITSPTFSSGKLRQMSVIMQKCIDNLEGHLTRITAESGSAIIETKATTASLTIDVIASTAFATQVNSFETGAENNTFLLQGRKMFDIKALKIMAAFLLPTWMLKILGIETVFDKSAFDFFISLTTHLVDRRMADPSARRPDLLQMLIDANVDEKELEAEDNFEKMIVTESKDENQSNVHQQQQQSTITKRFLTKNEIIGNAILIYVAGFETTASTIAHVLFSLAKNADIQERLFRELEQALDQFSEEEMNSEEYLTAVMTKVPYLEAVIKETMRRYAPLSIIGRICSTDNYQLGSVELFKGQMITIPVVALHMDPDNWPEPKRFDPERFMPENRHKIVPNSYLPFSDGPRNCIAMRFAYQEIKLCLAAIVRKFRFLPSDETPEALTFKPNSAVLIANEFKIKVERR